MTAVHEAERERAARLSDVLLGAETPPLFCRGAWIRAQNVWRRWMLAHNLPRIGGRPPVPFVTASHSNEGHGREPADEANQRLFINRYVEEDIRPDSWWTDAGGYFLPSGKRSATGIWEGDSERFPPGLRAASDRAHRHGITATRYVTGLLWWWDELRRRRDLLIGTCACEGRRNDLETLRRADP